MANEKLYTAKEAALAVLKKTHELLTKAEPAWKKPEADADQHAEGKGPKGEIHPKEQEQAPSDDVRSQQDPAVNPKENAEGNNLLWGTDPKTYGHLKLAKFIGNMEAKRKIKQGVSNG